MGKKKREFLEYGTMRVPFEIWEKYFNKLPLNDKQIEDGMKKMKPFLDLFKDDEESESAHC